MPGWMPASMRALAWMVPRRVPAHLAARIVRRQMDEDRLKAEDKAFFYSDFVVEEVVG